MLTHMLPASAQPLSGKRFTLSTTPSKQLWFGHFCKWTLLRYLMDQRVVLLHSYLYRHDLSAYFPSKDPRKSLLPFLDTLGTKGFTQNSFVPEGTCMLPEREYRSTDFTFVQTTPCSAAFEWVAQLTQLSNREQSSLFCFSDNEWWFL